MNARPILLVLGLLVAFALFVGLTADTAFAQEKVNKSADKNIAQKKGISGSLQTSKPEEEADGPSKLQMGIGVGSIFVMIAVVKWL